MAQDANPFDQFDGQPPAANPFDQFDPKTEVERGIGSKAKDVALTAFSSAGKGVTQPVAAAAEFLQAPAANTLSGLIGAAAWGDRQVTNAANTLGADWQQSDGVQDAARTASQFAADSRRENREGNPVAGILGAVADDMRERTQAIADFQRDVIPELGRQQKAVDDADGFVGTLTALGANPLAPLAMGVESMPSTVAGLGAGQAAGRATLAAGGGRAAATGAASAAGIASEAATSALLGREQTYSQVLSMPHEKLAQESPRYQELVKSGLAMTAAREKLANELADQVAVLAGAATAAGSKVVNRLAGGDTTASILAGRSVTPRMVAKNTGQEGGEEALQGLGEEYVQHGAIQQADADADFDVGGTLAQGAVMGGAFGMAGTGGQYVNQQIANRGEDVQNQEASAGAATTQPQAKADQGSTDTGAAAPAAGGVPDAGRASDVQAPGVGQFDHGAYVQYRRTLESGGKADAKNPNSSAYGVDQFTRGTWLDTVRQAKPSWAQGLSESELLEQRANPGRSGEMAAYLDGQNADILRSSGLPVTNETLYAAHHFGVVRGKRFARAPGDARMDSILSEAQINANPYLKGLTKDQAIANWNRRAGAPHGDIGARLAELEVLDGTDGLTPEQREERDVLREQAQQEGQREQEAETIGQGLDEQLAEAQAIDQQARQAQQLEQPAELPRQSLDATDIVLQNRDRSTAASIEQMNAIAANPDYLRTGPSRTMDQGAPVVFGDLPATSVIGREEMVADGRGDRVQTRYAVVDADDVLTSNTADGLPVSDYVAGLPGKLRAVAGNGRAAGLAEAYRRGSAARYRAELEADAQNVGIEPSSIQAMRTPVLVRVMNDQDVTPDIGDRSNTVATARLSPVEEATNDAKRIDLGALEYDDAGNPSAASVRAFVTAMPEAERGNMLNPDGSPTRQAVDRIAAAAFKQAYGNDELVRLYAQATDPEARAVMTALADSAGAMSQLTGAGEFDIRQAVADAAAMAVNARRRGLSLREMLQNRDLDMNPEAFVIAEFFAENSRSAKRMAEGLRNFAQRALEQVEIARQNVEQMGMFGDQPTLSRSELFEEFQGGRQQRNGRQEGRQQAAAQRSGIGPDEGLVEPAGADGRTEGRGKADRREGGSAGGQQTEGVTAQEPLLSDYTPDEIRQRHEQQEEAQAQQKQQDEAAEQAELQASERREIARRSDAAAETFELGQDAQDNLSGQQAMFRRQAGDPLASLGALPAQSRQVREQRVADVLQAADRVAGGWKNRPDVVVLGSLGDARTPAAVARVMGQAEAGTFGDVEGFFYGGKVYLVAENLPTDADVARVMLHESLGHYGLRGVFGDGFGRVLEDLIFARQRDVIRQARAYGLHGDGITAESSDAEVWRSMSRKQREEAAEEVLAFMAQEQPELGFVRRAVAAIRSWLRDNMPELWRPRMSDDEIINNYLIPAREWVRQGKELRESRMPTFASEAAVRFQRVWHGTPHRGIEKTGFKLNKIGTGEGAQAYGYGMYFAGRREVAEHYRSILAGRDGTPDGYAAHVVAVYGGDEAKALSYLRSILPSEGETTFTGESRQLVQQAMESLQDGGYKEKADQGQLYQAEIPEDSDLLDFEKPLSEQPQKVREAVGNIRRSVPQEMRWMLDGITPQSLGKDLYGTIGELAAEMNPDGVDNVQQAASELLLENGVPGLRYLDGGSRGGASGWKVRFKNGQYSAQAFPTREEAQAAVDAGQYNNVDRIENVTGNTANYVIWDEALLTPEAAQITPMFSRSPATKAAYEARIDALFAGEKAKTGTRILDSSDVMGLLGYPKVPLILNERHLRDGLTNHPEMTVAAWKNVPQWIESPAAVYSDPRDTGRLIVIAPDTLAGYPVMMVIEPNPNPAGSRSAPATPTESLLVTAYAKTTGGLPAAGYLASSGNLKYVDMKSAPEIWRRGGVQFPKQADLSQGRKKILTQKNLAGYRKAQQQAGGDDVRFSRATADSGDFDQSAGGSFNEADFRAPVLAWAKDRFGDKVAPNGKPVWQNFAKWFGDSKVVDAEGGPLVVYRYAKSEDGIAGGVRFFSKEADYAESYFEEMGRRDGLTAAVYLNLRDPLVVDMSGREFSDPGAERPHIEKAMADGRDGVIFRSGVDEFYVSFRPEQIKSATGNQGTFDGADPDIRFSRPPVPKAAQSLLTKVQDRVRRLTSPENIDSLIYDWQDRFIDLKRIQQTIKDLGGTISETNDAYLGEELYHKRVAARTQNFLRDELRPLLKAMNDAKVGVEEFERFLHARHAPEANRELAKRNPSDGELKKLREDADADVKRLRLQLQRATAHGGHTSSIQKALALALNEKAKWDSAQAFRGTDEERMSLSGMSDAEAQRIMDGYKPERRAEMETLAKKVDAINKRTLRELEDYGLMDKESLEQWRSTYQHYVPLHRDEAHPDSVAHPIGQGFSVKGDAAKRRVGSNEKVTHILGHIAMQREAALTRGEKNNVTKRLYILSKQNPNPDLWTHELPKRRMIDPDTGLVKTIPDQAALLRDNVVRVRIGGQDRYIIFNERNDRAARLATALRNLDAMDMDRFTRTMGGITRWFAAVNTQYNPIFGLTNLARDVQGAALQLSTTPLKGKEGQVLKLIRPGNAAKIYRSLRDARDGKGVGKNEWAQLWEQMNLDGGMTGYRDLFTRPEDRADALVKELRQLNGDAGVPAKIARGVGGWLSDFNETLEGITRLATYKVALDNGLSRQQAASIAKNITVNFNRKGRNIPVLGSYYAFLNAAIQGNVRLFETISGPRGRQIMLGGVALGALSTLAGMMVMGGDGDDDNWSKIPDFIKERNLIIPISSKDYISIPMPLGYHVFPNTGRTLVEMFAGGDPTKSKVDYLGDMLLAAVDAYNPLGGSENVVQMMTPSPFDPAVALIQNKDWNGRQIYRDSFSSLDPEPGHALAKDSATGVSRWVARIVNSATGGTEWTPGKISPNPDAIEYLFGQITGGVGREITKAGNMAQSVVTGEELPSHKIVLAGRFYGSVRGANGQSDRFYKNVKRINEAMNEAEGRIRERGEGADAVLTDVPLAKLNQTGKQAQKRVSDLRKLRQQVQKSDTPNKREMVKEINGQIEGVMLLLNQAVRDVLTEK